MATLSSCHRFCLLGDLLHLPFDCEVLTGTWPPCGTVRGCMAAHVAPLITSQATLVYAMSIAVSLSGDPRVCLPVSGGGFCMRARTISLVCCFVFIQACLCVSLTVVLSLPLFNGVPRASPVVGGGFCMPTWLCSLRVHLKGCPRARRAEPLLLFCS